MVVKSEIEKKINDTARFSKRIKEYAEQLNKLYKIPNGLSSDYLTKRLDIETASPEIKTAIGKVMGVNVDDSVIAGWEYEIPKLPKQFFHTKDGFFIKRYLINLLVSFMDPFHYTLSIFIIFYNLRIS